MKKAVLFLILMSFLSACNSNTIYKKPDNLLSKEKMAAILADTYIAKVAKGTKNLNGQIRVNYSSLIYKNHQTDSITFNNSLKYYVTDISQHEEILKMAQQKLVAKIEDTEKRIEKREFDIEEEMKLQEKDTL